MAYVTTAQEKIDAAITLEEMDAAVQEAKTAINTVEVLKPVDPTPDSGNNSNSEEEVEDEDEGSDDITSMLSCSSSAGMSAGIGALLSAALLFFKKRKDD